MATTISDVLCSVGRSGYFNKDLMAVKAGAEADGFAYRGRPVLPGFTRVVQPGTALSVMLVLDDGQVAFGDCTDVILAGVAGRDPVFAAEAQAGFVRGPLRAMLRGRPVDRFRPLAEEVDRTTQEGRPLHTALRYGVTQALLHGAALAGRVTMAEIVARDYGATIATGPVPILASCQRDDALQLDRMILKRADLLPHASFQVVERDIGRDGGKLMAYAKRVASRIREIGDSDYRPTLHLDVYGTLGELFGDDLGRLADYLATLEAAVRPHALLIESPIIAQSREAQIEAYRRLRAELRRRGSGVRLIVDEWCNTLDDVRAFAAAEAADLAQVKAPDLGGVNNTIEALLHCRAAGMGACLGGSGNETDQSTRITAHIGLACRPDFMLAKPGFGGDEALMIETNEMARTLTLIAARRPQ